MKVEIPIELAKAILHLCLNARTDFKVGEVLQVLQQFQIVVEEASMKTKPSTGLVAPTAGIVE